MKSEVILALLIAALAAPFAANAQTMNTPAAPALNKTDMAIVTAMAQANIAEIEAAKLALANGNSAEVKTFAKQMIDDHTKALNDVNELAQDKGITLPSAPDAKHKAMTKRLGKLKGDAFDKKYMAEAGVADHKKVLAALRKDQARARDPDVKALAAKMLPTVEQHLHQATGAKVSQK